MNSWLARPPSLRAMTTGATTLRWNQRELAQVAHENLLAARCQVNSKP